MIGKLMPRVEVKRKRTAGKGNAKRGAQSVRTGTKNIKPGTALV